MIVTHIDCWAASDERQHVLDESCWCGPEITRYGSNSRAREAHTVIAHSGQVHPSVKAGGGPFDLFSSRIDQGELDELDAMRGHE